MSILAHRNRNEDFFIERWKPNGVTPLEIWDLVIDDKNLWEWQDFENYPDILLSALIKLRAGNIQSESKGAIDPIAQDFDSIFITGGRSQIPALRDSLYNFDIPISFGNSPVQGACVAAVNSFQALGENLIAIDVGQTQIKIAFADKSVCFERNLSILPLPDPPESSSLADQRKLLAEFISTSIATTLSETQFRPTKALLALPCFIHPNCDLGGSSYIGMKEHPTLLREVISGTALSKIPWLITNDAELAALPALSEPTFENVAKTLVLTLGFGSGACILEHQR